MQRYDRGKDWREDRGADDYRREGRKRRDEGMLERIKNDVKAWFADEDDDYEGAGYGTADAGSRGSSREDWDRDRDRFRNTGSRSRFGRHSGESDYDEDYGRYGYGSRSGSSYRSGSASRFGSQGGRFDEDTYGGYRSAGSRSRGRDFGSQGYSSYGGDFGESRGGYGSGRDDYDDDYRRQLSSSGRRSTPFVLYSEYWVTPGPHSGVGPKGYQRSPNVLKERVCERLQDHGELNAANIEVECADEEITLTGTVDSRREKRLAEECAESVYGVRDVHNRLSVRQYEGSSAGQGAAGQSTTGSRDTGATKSH
ncbi:MAG TPA: BON domain-containing protein [Woeseiaceae bacterium]|nr:BON domain-containing protein [Woeseiaceae bacterium]